ncbi:MAG TPA: MFS transporter [Mycobacteriales bacterium]|nr:MFS transporter [Mycobacteriales bacterium]
MSELPHVPRRPGFWLVGYAFAVTMLGTTLPTPLYPAYEQRFSFDALMVTVIYAVYAFGVMAALLLVGRASDQLGRKTLLLPGLVFSGLSSVVFLVVGGVHHAGIPLLLTGRIVSGLSAGVFTGTATATLTDLAGPGRQAWAGLVAAVVNIGGLGLGPLTGGLLARWVGLPLQTCYALHLGLVLLAVAAVAVVPEPVEVVRPRRLVLQRLQVPAPIRTTFVQAVTAGFAGFAVLGLFTAVSPAFLGLLGHHDPALTGLIVFSIFVASAVGQVLSARWTATPALLAGTALLVLGMVIVALGLGARSLPWLVVGAVIAGAGQGLSFRAALSAVTTASPVAQRGGVSSSFFAVCYIGISVPVIGVGVAAKHYGLVHTGEVFAGIVAALALAAFASLLRSRPRPVTVDNA